MSLSLPGSWSPDDTAHRARMAALARSAQTAGREISAPALRGFLQRFERDARTMVGERLEKGEQIADVEAEVLRVAGVLRKLHMTDLAHRPRKPRSSRSSRISSPKGVKSRATECSRDAAVSPTPARSRFDKTVGRPLASTPATPLRHTP